MANLAKSKVAIVTGASSGIGAATAITLALKGYQVVGLARRLDLLMEVAAKTKSGTIHIHQCDVSDKEQVISTFKWINEKFGGVDVLVNNAGYGSNGTYNGTYEEWKKMMDLNVLGATLCTQEALKTMRKRGDDGIIINISSIAGFIIPSVFDIGMYSASKHALTALSQCISNDLAKENSNIRITNLSPGTVYTEMVMKHRMAERGLKYDRSVLEEPVPDQYLDPQDIADAILYILSTPSRVQVLELTIQPVRQKKI